MSATLRFGAKTKKRGFELRAAMKHSAFKIKAIRTLRKTKKIDIEAQSCCIVCITFTFFLN